MVRRLIKQDQIYIHMVVQKSLGLITHAINFFMHVLNIFRIIMVAFVHHMQKLCHFICNHQRVSNYTLELRGLSTELASCNLSGAQNLEMTLGFRKICVPSPSYIYITK